MAGAITQWTAQVTVITWSSTSRWINSRLSEALCVTQTCSVSPSIPFLQPCVSKIPESAPGVWRHMPVALTPTLGTVGKRKWTDWECLPFCSCQRFFPGMRINTPEHGDRGRQSTPREATHGQTMKQVSVWGQEDCRRSAPFFLFLIIAFPLSQILLFGLLFVHIWRCKMSRCYDEHELREVADRKLRSHYPQPLDPSPAAYLGSSCPVKLYQQQQLPKHLSGRSLSPWRYM